MRVRKRRITENAWQHIYQKTSGNKLLFYDDFDRLVFFTAFVVTARRYHASVLAFALMYDHTHALVRLENPFRIGAFVRDYASLYAMEFNRDIERHGAVFCCAYGNAPKEGAKRLRTTVAYIDNNAVEKGLFKRAEDDRWNLMAYLCSDHPFSEKLVRRDVSRKLGRSLKRVELYSSRNAFLRYQVLRDLFDGLNGKESAQLTDFIISSYNPLDKDDLMLLYGDYRTMLVAVNANTGSEYDLKEDYGFGSHDVYRRLLDICRESAIGRNLKSVLVMPVKQKIAWADTLGRLTGASSFAIKKFLGL